MGFNSSKSPFLYSVGTHLAYLVAQRYYNDIHYVWCTTRFNDLKQPPTSNPATICERYLKIITTGDRHAVEIDNNIAGILRGAKEKFDLGIIDKKKYNNIKKMISAARYEGFYPVIYIIESEKVKNRCVEVDKTDKASDDAIEYKIKDLKSDEFEIIFLKDILSDIISVVDKEVAE